ncbi:MAG: hypothetical protein QOD33_1368 [Pyrinomonadaceae bacterium]|nr:hypothetical protein [Pyrinomonadaceae bacterium]
MTAERRSVVSSWRLNATRRVDEGQASLFLNFFAVEAFIGFAPRSVIDERYRTLLENSDATG